MLQLRKPEVKDTQYLVERILRWRQVRRGRRRVREFLVTWTGFPLDEAEWIPEANFNDTLAWATGTRVGTGDHAIALFCIKCGRVLGFLYFDTFTLHFEVKLCALQNVFFYMWL